MKTKKYKKTPPRRKSIKVKRSGRPRNSLGIHSRRHLMKAHNLMEKGRHAESAPIFEEIANGAFDQKLKQCAWLYVRSGQAYVLSGQVEKGFSLFKKSLKFLADTNRWDIFSRIKNRIIIQLEKEFGHPEQGDALQSWIGKNFPERQVPFDDSHKSIDKKLPLRCSYCGAPVNPVELEISTRKFIHCAYCGKNL